MTRKLSKKEAGKIGGLARQAMYGDLGTPEGRKLGGLNSLATHRKNRTGFKLLKKVRKPRHSSYLAEFIGIMLGDGHVDKYQATVTTNSETDRSHAYYVKKLVSKLFSIEPGLSFRKDVKACMVVISSRAVCDFLENQGLPRGNKVIDGIRIPSWIRDKKTFSRLCVRGLFDTDGCVYCDTHRIRGKIYRNIGLAFTNRNKDILDFFKLSLIKEKLNPTQRTPYTVFLRREEDIARYFEIIGSSNEKHKRRYSDFLRLRGGVA